MSDPKTLIANARTRVMRALHDEDAAQVIITSLWLALQQGPVDVDRYIARAIRNQRSEGIHLAVTARQVVELEDAESLSADEGDQPARDFASLPDQKRQIAELLTAGHSIGELPALLGISRSTFHRHAKQIRAA